MNFNVVENISKYFGIEPSYYYLEGLRENYEDRLLFLSLFGLCYFTVQQFSGSLTSYNAFCKQNGLKVSKIPFVFIYSVAYIVVLSLLDHKELRFYTPVIQLSCLA